MGAFGGTGSIYEDYNALLSSSFDVPVGETATSNFQRFSDPDVDALLDEFKVPPTRPGSTSSPTGCNRRCTTTYP